MTLNDARAKDKRFTLVACIAFVLAMILYVVSSQIAGDTGRKSAFSGDLVFADVTSTPQVIRITTNRSDYQLRNADGVWVMPEKADYPISWHHVWLCVARSAPKQVSECCCGLVCGAPVRAALS